MLAGPFVLLLEQRAKMAAAATVDNTAIARVNGAFQNSQSTSSMRGEPMSASDSYPAPC
jgi:hypothetical protein